MAAQFHFQRRPLYTISHIVVLFGFHHNWHPIRSDMIVQCRFQHRLQLYDQSLYCPVWFSSQKTLGPISHNNSICVNHTYTIGHVFVLSDFHHRLHTAKQVSTVEFRFWRRQDLYDWSRCYPIGFYHRRTWFNQSQQLIFIFGVDRIYKISHVVFIYIFRHSRHLIWSIMIVHYHFRCILHLYDQ